MDAVNLQGIFPTFPALAPVPQPAAAQPTAAQARLFARSRFGGYYQAADKSFGLRASKDLLKPCLQDPIARAPGGRGGGSKDAPLKRPDLRERGQIYDLKAKIFDLRRRIDHLEERRRRLKQERRTAEARALAEAARASGERAGHAEAIAYAGDLAEALAAESAARREGGWWLVAGAVLAAASVLAPVPVVARVAGLGVSFACLSVAAARLLMPLRGPAA